MPQDAGSSRPPQATRSIPDAAPTKRHAELVIGLGPYCDAYVDGKAVGSSPSTRVLRLAPGAHLVECKKGPRGASYSKRIVLHAGKRRLLTGQITAPIMVSLGLRRGDSVRVDGVPRRGAFALTAGPHRVDLVRGGKVVAGGWVRFPPVRRCKLVDTPKLRCVAF